MSKTIGIALVGLGYWGENYLRTILQSREARLKYVCDSKTDKLRRHAGLTGTASVNFTTDSTKIAEDREVEAVIISTPASSHYEIAKRMLEAGKHVLVEKPLTMSHEQALELCDLSDKMDRTLMVGHIYCFNPAVNYFRDIIKGGQLGDLYYGIGLRLGLGPIRSDASCIWDLATHDIAMLDYVLDQMPSYASAHALSFFQRAKGIYDYADIQLEYGNGFRFSLIVSWYAAEKIRGWYLVGSKAMLKFDDMKKDTPIAIYKRTIAPVPASFDYAKSSLALVPREGDVIIPYIRQDEPLMLEVRYFVECIKLKKKPLSDGEQGLRVVRILEAIDESARNHGRTVKLRNNE